MNAPFISIFMTIHHGFPRATPNAVNIECIATVSKDLLGFIFYVLVANICNQPCFHFIEGIICQVLHHNEDM